MVLPVAYGGSGSGSGGFALGPSVNNFSGANKAAAEAVRDAYATANTSWLAQYDADSLIGTYLSYVESSPQVVTNQVRVSGVWRDSTSTMAIQGVAGSAGISGNSYFFSSDSHRDNFFSIPANRVLLEHDLPITVNNDGSVEISYWAGVTAPLTYNTSFWRAASLTVPPWFGNPWRCAD